MKPDRLVTPDPQETELKLALPTSDPAGLAKRLARLPVLARRTPRREQLHNVYYDTPDQVLRQRQVALRIRRIGSGAEPRWLQTLKKGGDGGSALSQRGEWEAPVAGATLSPEALDAKAWAKIDPDGTLFPALVPCFVTDFERTIWLVRRRDGSMVEVALDIGHVAGGDKSAPLCELELELKAGPVSALFVVALQIAASVSVLPLNMGKAQRGYALALDAIHAPVSAAPPVLTADLPLGETVRRVLREMFGQFTTNLNALRGSDDPEVVHQGRVAWRRFRSARRLFKPVLAEASVPSWLPLQPLMTFLGELRDLDVARTETLPPLESAYVAGDAHRAGAWDAMAQSLLQAASVQRKAVLYALEDPAVGACLLATTQWIEGLPAAGEAPGDPRKSTPPLRQWARRRTTKLHAQLKLARKDASSPELQHRVRILAKRTRYGIEALRSLLPKRIAQGWHRQAADVQKSIGATRDLEQAVVLLNRLGAEPGLVDFLRGVATGQQSR